MAEHLLVISVGPIQGFISAARRTRDLWFGSEVLSEVSRAAARVVEASGELIMPAPESLAPGCSVANIILGTVRDGVAPKDVARDARAAMMAEWERRVAAAFDVVKEIVRPELWEEQKRGVLEFQAVWTVLGTDYAAARKRVMRLLAGRKACRDFQHGPERPGVPKSSLDGARESVLQRDRDAGMTVELKRRLRLSTGEQLDLPGMVKRAATDRGYPSVSRIAADPWLRGLSDEDRRSLEERCAPLKGKGLIWLPREDFPYEGTAVYRHRHKELAKETGTELTAYQALGKEVERLEKEYGIPEPYVAFLQADGDRMGARISGMTEKEEHREFSQKLVEFAVEARRVVQKYRGSTVFAGGDDVLAMVPVDQVLKCAEELHTEFAKTGGTLSVGIAIGHFMEPMEDLLEFARQAERHAKNGGEKTPEEKQRAGGACTRAERGSDRVAGAVGGWAADAAGGMGTGARGWRGERQGGVCAAADGARVPGLAGGGVPKGFRRRRGTAAEPQEGQRRGTEAVAGDAERG
jgi:CRISPR-associated protein Cmr2